MQANILSVQLVAKLPDPFHHLWNGVWPRETTDAHGLGDMCTISVVVMNSK